MKNNITTLSETILPYCRKQYYHTVGNNITTLSETILPHCRKQYYHTVGNNITTLSETILPHCQKQYYHTVGTIAKANQKIVEASSSSSKYSASFNLKIIALVWVRKQSVLFTSEYVNMYMFQNRKSAGKTGKNNWNCLWC
jgi:hypothetical protein